jgi:hypothetical protein
MMKFAIAAILLMPMLASAAQGALLPLKLAKEKGFTGCDATINGAFVFVNGRDVRATVAWFDETKGDAIKVTTTSSNPGDNLFVEAEFRKQGGKCFVNATSIITSEKSCAAFLAESPAFNVQYVIGEFTWTRNANGVLMYLMGAGTGCIAIYQLNNKQPQQN